MNKISLMFKHGVIIIFNGNGIDWNLLELLRVKVITVFVNHTLPLPSRLACGYYCTSPILIPIDIYLLQFFILLR